MQEDKIKHNMKVKLVNLVNRFYYADQEEYWTELMNEEYIGVITGRSKQKKVNDERWDLDNSSYRIAYEIIFTIHNEHSDEGEDENIFEYFFPENFELALREAPKNDIEWLDRVKHNFQWAR